MQLIGRLLIDDAVFETPLIVVTLPDRSTGTRQQLIWEYPRQAPHGDQGDLIELIDIVRGLIIHHRVYRGWANFKSLVAAVKKGARSLVKFERAYCTVSPGFSRDQYQLCRSAAGCINRQRCSRADQ
jgi:hypothetical protein